MRQSPEASGIARSRWTLDLLRQHCPCLKKLKSRSGTWRRLRRWKLVYKRARFHLHSPDPDYTAKVERLAKARRQADKDPQQRRLLFADEVGIYRQPLVTDAWQSRGKEALKATLSHRANTRLRVVGALDSHTGQVIWHGASKVGVKALCHWLKQVREAYGPRCSLTLVWDNWPIHSHEKVLKAAEDQRIELLYLPTYAPWTNPIEKLWRKLKQEVLYLHRQADQWDLLKERVAAFLANFATGSSTLLHYVGIKALTE